MKSALFVDFDNVFSGLKNLDPAIAERFARQPMRWMHWLLDALALPEHAPADAKRRLLVRRVYLNPQVYQGFRVGFNHAGFEIVDCPAMTHQGKTSTDIHMVLDMVDLLQHEVRYDEFIVFSADADFTPVLRKLRRWDRRTTVLAVGFPSGAYRASADLLIDTDLFIRDGLGLGQVDADEPARPALSADSAAGVPVVQPAEAADEASLSVDDIISHLRNEVARSELPVPCARLAAQLMAARPGLAPDWLGQGSFRRFLESLALAPLTLDWRSSGGYLLDPTRHEVTLSGPLHGVPVSESSWGLDRLTLALIRQVHEATGVPMLSPREFRGLLDAIVADVAEQPFQLSETGKRVRDRCREQGLAVSRLDVNWVLRGVQMAGHAFGLGHDDLATLSYRLVGNLINLCRREQVALDEGSAAVLQRWVSGRFGEG